MGRYGSFAYIAVTDQSTATDGFVKYTHLDKVINGFLNLSSTDMDVWANGLTYENRKLTTTYKGEVEWVVGNEDYITFDKTTGQIVGIVPGQTTTITAKSDGMTAKCTIHLLYKWPQVWTAKTNKKTNIYQTEGTEYEKGRTLAKGETFVVQGDCGTDNGWAYGYYPISDNNKIWGYIPIADVSTKGTVSQYNNLGWSWPVLTPSGKPSANYISSPYGWRDTKPKNHQGIDITTGTAGEIAGYNVVSVFDGTVVFCCDEYGYDWGYCVAIRSDEKDPVSGKQYVAVYMHLDEPPKLMIGQSLKKGNFIGYVGNTTTPGVNMGYHLHFEFNNQNSSVGLSGGAQTSGYGRKSYDYLVNPIFVYIDEYEDGKIKYNKSSDSETKYMKTFWYGNGDTLDEAS